jgi:hypothetical protein
MLGVLGCRWTVRVRGSLPAEAAQSDSAVSERNRRSVRASTNMLLFGKAGRDLRLIEARLPGALR